MSKKKMLESKFRAGDIIGGKDEAAVENRTVISVDYKKQCYGLGFPNDNLRVVYRWTFHQCHQTYILKPPSHIPQEQHDMYRRLDGRY